MSLGSSVSLSDGQAWQNRSTAGQWGMYASHRRAMERLLVPGERGRDRLCVLGAGNCNDLDLNWLTEVYREVHLVDIDRDAIEGAVRRQQVARGERVVLHGPVDLTGAGELVGEWRGRRPTAGEAGDYVRRAEGAPLPQLGRFEVVLSPCVLSQLIYPVREALGSDHPSYAQVRGAVRSRHLRVMHSMLETGGEGVLVVDLVSSQTFEGLARVEEERLPELMRRLLEDGKFFKGLQPAAIEGTMRGILREGEGAVRFTRPWRWHLSLEKSFLVYAARWTRMA